MAQISLTPPQSEIWESLSSKRFTVVAAGRRFGKSYLSSVWLFTLANRTPQGSFFFVAPTYGQAKQILYRQFEQLFGEYIKKRNVAELTFTLENDSVIYLKGAENRDALRGVSLDGLVMDEAEYMDEEVWSMVLQPATSDKEAPVMFISSPNGVGSWFHKLWERGHYSPDEFEDWASHQYSTSEGGNVSEKELLRARRELDPKVYAREYLASFTTISGQVYPNFDKELNILKEKPNVDEHYDIHIGIDFNVGQMSAVCAVKVSDQIQLFDEILLPESNTQNLTRVIQDKFPEKRIFAYPDPSGRSRKTSAIGGETDFSILERAGFTVIAPRKHNAISDRIATVNSLLCNANKYRRLFVYEKCREITRSLEGQAFDMSTQQPDKKGGLDHCFSGDTLIRVNGDLMRFDEIPESGFVMDYTGKYVKYIRGGQKGIRKDMLRLNLTTGEQIVCTSDHEILTTQGWMEAKELRPSNQILSLNTIMLNGTKPVARKGSIFQELIRQVIKDLCFIGRFTSRIVGKYQRGITSTISTITQRTTNLVIYYVCPQVTISNYMAVYSQRSKNNSIAKYSINTDTKPQNGIDRKKVESGIENITKITKTIYIRKWIRFVNNVVKSIKDLYMVNTAQETVRVPLDVNQELITKPKLAKSAEVNLNGISTVSVKDVQSVVHLSESQETYCLEVPDQNHFVLANGAVVSNCADSIGYLCLGINPTQGGISRKKIYGI